MHRMEPNSDRRQQTQPAQRFSEGLAAESPPKPACRSPTTKSRWCAATSPQRHRIETRMGGSTYQVTRNTTERTGGDLLRRYAELHHQHADGCARLAVHDAVTAQLVKAGVRRGHHSRRVVCGRGCRTHQGLDVASALANDPSRLRLAPFEIISIDGVEHRPMSYTETMRC